MINIKAQNKNKKRTAEHLQKKEKKIRESMSSREFKPHLLFLVTLNTY
jgi:hypothetical protein